MNLEAYMKDNNLYVSNGNTNSLAFIILKKVK